MAEGQVYVEVDGSAIGGGIMPMAVVSGNPEPVDGQSFVVVWIRWRYDDTTGAGGYTGTGWYFDDPNNNIKKHYNTIEEFYYWLTNDKPTSLDSVLGDWSAEKKADFLNAHLGTLKDGNCIYFTA